MTIPFELDRPVHIALGAYGAVPHGLAIAKALHHSADPVLGQLSPERMQLCPQGRGRLDAEFAHEIVKAYPHIEWRLHANVQLESSQRVVDLVHWPQERAWFSQLAQVSAALKAPVYTAHAGRRDQGTVDQVLRAVRELEQLLGIPVGVEGHYPTPKGIWLFSCWVEYRKLLESGVPYALDVSHLHILATQSGRIEWSLVQEMLSSPQCLEVHVSANDGCADQHRQLHEPTWWLPLLKQAHPDAVFFSEGKQSSDVYQAFAGLG